MQAAEVHDLLFGELVLFSTRAPDKTAPNEDAATFITVDEGQAVLAVADGMGGSPAGRRASKLALEELLAAIVAGRKENKKLRNAILNGFENANRAVQGLGVGAATTIAVAEIDGNKLRTYHAGDSKVLLVGQRGKLKWQTIGHSQIDYAVESGMLAAAEAMHHEDRHLVLSAVGSTEMRVEISSVIKLASRDTLILATDGLFDNLHLNEIVDAVRKGKLNDVAADLVSQTLARMQGVDEAAPSKPDDLTFIVYRPTA